MYLLYIFNKCNKILSLQYNNIFIYCWYECKSQVFSGNLYFYFFFICHNVFQFQKYNGCKACKALETRSFDPLDDDTAKIYKMYKMFVYFFKTNSVLASYITVFIFTIQMSFYWVDKNHNKKNQNKSS